MGGNHQHNTVFSKRSPYLLWAEPPLRLPPRDPPPLRLPPLLRPPPELDFEPELLLPTEPELLVPELLVPELLLPLEPDLDLTDPGMIDPDMFDLEYRP